MRLYQAGQTGAQIQSYELFISHKQLLNLPFNILSFSWVGEIETMESKLTVMDVGDRILLN